MARPKATNTGAEVKIEEAKKPDPESILDTNIRGMIDAMSRNVSIDMTKHQIQASILTRLEKWANKKIGSDGQVICPDWEKRLPQYIILIGKVSADREKRVADFMATKAKDKNKIFQDTIEKGLNG
jgi:hypothetical protein